MTVDTSIATPRQRHIAYFGYGSLVCRRTHRTQIVDAMPAVLHGWRRCWRPRPDMPGFPAALLTVRPHEVAACKGLLVVDRAENLAAVDAREARYTRIELDRATLSVAGQVPPDCPIYLYVADDAVPPHRDPPMILQSYLDAVMLGFLEEHGMEGLRHFVSETEGFETSIHRDRQAPLYPRAVTLDAAMAQTFDRLLDAHAAGRF